MSSNARVPSGNVIETLSKSSNAGTCESVMLVPVGSGKLTFTTSKASAVDVKVELLGYSAANIPPKAVGTTPREILKGTFDAGESQNLKVAGKNGLPGKKKLRAVLLQVTTKKGTTDGKVVAYAANGTAPSTRSRRPPGCWA